MSKVKVTVERTAKRDYRCHKEMLESYESMEWLLKQKVQDLGYALFFLRKEVKMFDVTDEYFTEFMHEKVLELVDESIAENIEKYYGRPLY